MENTIFQKFLNLNPDFMNQLEPDCELNFIEVGNYLYVCTNILTYGKLDYTVIFEIEGYDGINNISDRPNTAKVVSKEDCLKMGRGTPYNEGYYGKRKDGEIGIVYCNEHEANVHHVGVGAGLIIIDKVNISLKNVYYFPDTYNSDCPSEIIAQVGEKLLIGYSEYNYVFFEGTFTGFGFVAAEHRIFGNLLINFWHYGYDARCPWQLIDLGKMTCDEIYALDMNEHQEFGEINDCYYDYETSEFVFTFPDGNKVAMGIRELRANKDQADKLRFSNLGTPYGYCRLLP